jgi:hypothetical protein
MSERLRSIFEQIEIRPGDRALKIDCGRGLAAAFVCGDFTAVGRSST